VRACVGGDLLQHQSTDCLPGYAVTHPARNLNPGRCKKADQVVPRPVSASSRATSALFEFHMRSRTRRQPATPLAELVDRSPRRRALGTVNGNAQENRPLPPTKALTKAPTKALPSPPTLPPVSEPPTLVSVMSMDVLSLIFEFMDDGRGPLSLAVRSAADGLSVSCHTIHSVAKEPLEKMHASFDSLQKDASHFCVRVGGGTSTWLCKKPKVFLQRKRIPN
jgi:hypothetical protein